MAAPGAESSLPKKAPSGYWIWLTENRAEVVKALGGVQKGSEVSKKAGEMWKAMNEEAQAPYMQKSKEMKDKIEAARPPKEKQVINNDNLRKKPMTPVFAFIQEKREEIAAMPDVKGLGDISKKGAELFKLLSESEQAARKKRFEDEMAAYKLWATSADGEAALADKKSAVAEKRQAKKDRIAKKEAKVARKQAKEDKANGIVREDTEAVTPSPKTKKTRGSPKSEATSAKRGRGRAASNPAAAPAAKKARGRGRGSAAAQAGPDLEPEVLKEAQKLGFDSALKNLAARQEIVSIGKSSAEMLAALKKSNGLVNAAKHALLGA